MILAGLEELEEPVKSSIILDAAFFNDNSHS